VKKSEKIVTSILTLTLGILLMVLKGGTLQVFTSVVGVMLLVLSVFDFVAKDFKLGVAKCVIGALILVFGWLIVKVALYVLAAGLVIVGVWGIYDRIKCGVGFSWTAKPILLYARPVVCTLIGVLLLFNQGGTIDWVFVVGGILTVIEGGLLLLEALAD
jgi:hypothetical protein